MNSDDNIENLNDKSSHGGARPGAGRPKGSKDPQTIEREAAAEMFRERVAKNVDKLFNSQLDLATGEKYLMVITTVGQGTKQRKEVSVVTDPETIKKFLDDERALNTDTEYYYMSTKPANNQALEGLLNRAFGRAKESLDVTTGGDKLATGTADQKIASDFAEYLKNK